MTYLLGLRPCKTREPSPVRGDDRFRLPFLLLVPCFMLLVEARAAELESVQPNNLSNCRRHLKIGVTLPLTGPAAASGQSIKNSIQLADELHDSSACVDFVFEDDQLLPGLAVQAVNTLIARDEVDGLIAFGAPTGRVVAAIAVQQRIPTVALSPLDLDATFADRKYLVQLASGLRRMSDAAIAESRMRGYRRVAAVSSYQPAMREAREHFRRDAPYAIPLDLVLSSDDSNSSSIVDKISSTKPDAVYLLIESPQTGRFVRKLREAGYSGGLFGLFNLEEPEEVKVSAASLVGAWFVNDDPSFESYRERYQQRFGLPAAGGGGNGFDAAKLYIEAAQRDGEVVEFLRTVKNFQGAFGTYSATTEGGFDFPVRVKEVGPTDFQLVRDQTQESEIDYQYVIVPEGSFE